MAEEFSGYEQPQEIRLQENVSIEDYKGALQLLTCFAEIDVTNISRLEQLTEATRGIGQALRAIAVSKGRFTPGKITLEKIDAGNPVRLKREAEYIFEGQRGNDRIMLQVSKEFTNQEFANVRVYPPLQDRDHVLRVGHGVYLFSDRPLSVSGEFAIDHTVTAYEEQGERRAYYQPLEQPDNSQVQQSYAHVLQTCVKDVLSLNPPPPTEIPTAFYQ